MGASEPLLELRNISKRFAGVLALTDVSIAFRGGEIHCIAGQNGSGKSTLIKVVSGVHRPDAGEIRVNGAILQGWSPRQAIASGIQVIYQDFSLFNNLTVAENLALSTQLNERRRTTSRRQVQDIARRAASALDVHLDLDAEVGSLPVSGKQLVAIARALLSHPRLLIMDEPTTALTGTEIAVLFRVVRDIRDKGVAVVFVSHKMREMLDISDRLTVLRNGAVVAAGPASEFNEAAITRAMTGSEHEQSRYVYAADANPEPRLKVRGLTLPGHLDGIDLDLRAGEIVGMSGLLGAGRTEFASTVFGMHPGYRGTIAIDGRPVRMRSVQTAVDNGVAYVPEDRLSDGLFFGLTIGDNILSAAIGASKRFLLDTPKSGVSDTLAAMGINATGERLVGELSGGNQQRVVLGRWLLTGPRILLLNGPTVGVDVGAKADLHRRIRKLAQEDRLGVVMISDDVEELLHNCNRIIIMHRGRIVDEFEAAALTEDDVSDRLRALS